MSCATCDLNLSVGNKYNLAPDNYCCYRCQHVDNNPQQTLAMYMGITYQSHEFVADSPFVCPICSEAQTVVYIRCDNEDRHKDPNSIPIPPSNWGLADELFKAVLQERVEI